MGRSGTRRTARAFAPGHLTGFFVPDTSARDPRGRGSRGVGIVLDRGAYAEARWDPNGPRRTSLRVTPRVALPVTRDAVARTRGDRPGTLEIRLRHELPVGQGLGMSAAGSLAASLATARVLRRPLARAWQSAHLADLGQRGGLGGVAALGGGGLEERLSPGIPPWGRVRHRPVRTPILLVPFGAALPSPRLLGTSRVGARLERSGERALRTFHRDPSLAGFWSAAERFTDEVGLATPALLARAHALRSPGLAVAQAMFGRLLYLAPRSRADLPEFRRRLAGAPRPGTRLVFAGRRGAGVEEA